MNDVNCVPMPNCMEKMLAEGIETFEVRATKYYIPEKMVTMYTGWTSDYQKHPTGPYSHMDVRGYVTFDVVLRTDAGQDGAGADEEIVTLRRRFTTRNVRNDPNLTRY